MLCQLEGPVRTKLEAALRWCEDAPDQVLAVPRPHRSKKKTFTSSTRSGNHVAFSHRRLFIYLDEKCRSTAYILRKRPTAVLHHRYGWYEYINQKAAGRDFTMS